MGDLDSSRRFLSSGYRAERRDEVASRNHGATDVAAQYAELYRATHAEVLGFIARRLIPPDHARAEDIAHDTFMVAWRRFEEIPNNPSDARAWLFTTARNNLLKANDQSKRRAAFGVRISDEAFGFIPDSSDDFATRNLNVDLATAWTRLKPEEQEVIALTYWDELSSRDAGRVLGISDRAYRLKLHRARIALKKALEVNVNA